MSQATPIASLQVLFEAQTAQFQAGVNQAIGSLNKANTQFKQSIEPMNKMNKGFAAIGTSLKTLAGSFVILEAFGKAMQGLTQADEVVDTARAYGTFSSNILALQKALMTAGGSGDEFTNMLTRLSQRVDDAFQGNETATKTFQRLGISMSELSRLNLTEQFERISSALGGMEDKTTAVAIGTEIFGRKLAGIEWSSFNESIRKYITFTDALKVAVNEAGGDISKLTEDQRRFIDTWEGYEYAATYIDRMKLAVKKLAVSMTSELGWALVKLEANFAGFKAFLFEMGEGFDFVTEAIDKLLGFANLLASNEGLKKTEGILARLFPESHRAAVEAYDQVLKDYAETVRKSNQAIADQEGKVTNTGRAFKTAGDQLMEGWLKGLDNSILAMNMLPAQIASVEKQIRALGDTSNLSAEQLTKLKVLQEEHLRLSEKLDSADPMKKWADGIYAAGQAIDLVPAKMEELNRAFEGGFIGLNQYRTEMEALNQAIQTDGQKAWGDFQVAITGFGVEFGNKFIDNLRAGKDAFSGFMEDLTSMILKFMMNRLVTQFMTSMFGGAPGSATAAAGGGFKFFANGGAFGGTTGLPYGVYDKPTFFNMPGNGPLQKFASGGVLGEAGPEAIMPLRRSGDGKLGVAAAPVSVTVNNYSDVKVSTAESTGDDGSRQISITIQREVKSMFGDGSMDKVMRGSYGLSRQAA